VTAVDPALRIVGAALAGTLVLSGCQSADDERSAAAAGAPAHAPTAGPVTSPPAAAVPTLSATVRPSAAPKPGAPARPAPCRLFPADSIWHADVSKLPVHRASAAYVGSIGAGSHLHPDFGSGLIDGSPFGIPVTRVPAGQRRVKVTFDYAGESDRGPYPIPADARVEGGPGGSGDRHVILHDPAGCRLYELYAAERRGAGWHAGSGAVYDLRSNRLRPDGWTSADAAGLPIMAGLVRYEEVAAGRVDHAIRVTVPRSRADYVWPARHAASDRRDASLPPMGLRLRLKASVDISGLPRQARVIAQALKTYGVIVADNGSPWFISGTQDSRWDNDALGALKDFTGADFEAVDTLRLMADRNSGRVRR
jgi:hypothetical protein